MTKTEASILIVDDDPAIRTAARMFLKQMFKLVITCSKPEQVPGMMKETRFDVILLDMNFTKASKLFRKNLNIFIDKK